MAILENEKSWKNFLTGIEPATSHAVIKVVHPTGCKTQCPHEWQRGLTNRLKTHVVVSLVAANLAGSTRVDYFVPLFFRARILSNFVWNDHDLIFYSYCTAAWEKLAITPTLTISARYSICAGSTVRAPPCRVHRSWCSTRTSQSACMAAPASHRSRPLNRLTKNPYFTWSNEYSHW